jgi:hypothetical protein
MPLLASRVALGQLHQHYKKRFGIETSYRIKNGCRIRTTSKNPVTRLLFVALAFILVNLWVYLLWFFVSRTQRGGRVVYRVKMLCHVATLSNQPPEPLLALNPTVVADLKCCCYR